MQGQHSYSAVLGVGLHGVHRQIVGDGDAVKAAFFPQNFVNGRGEGRRQLRVHAVDDVVAHQHKRSPGFDPRLEGQQVGSLKGLHRPLIHGDAGVGVCVITVAGEVLQYRQRTALCHGRHHQPHIIRRHVRVLPQRPVIDEILRVSGHVAHRREIHVDPQRPQLPASGVRIPENFFNAADVVQLLRRFEGFREEVRVPAGPGDSAALLVASNKQGDSGRILVALDFLDELLPCQPAVAVLVVPAKQQIAS